MADSPPQRLGIIGSGRVAQALALGFAKQSTESPLIWGRSRDSVAAASVTTDSEAAVSLDRLVSDCDVIAIAVSDDAIGSVVDDIARSLPFGRARFVFHVSGKSGAVILEPLRSLGALTAAIHPAMTFTGNPMQEVARMAEARFAITGSPNEAVALARQIVARLGGTAVEIGEDQRPLYHAALCHASNHLVTLLAGASLALTRSGVDDPAALIAPLVRAALENSLNHGFTALSGPVLRGDARTVEGHVAALRGECADLLPAYRAMALSTLDELERRGTASNGPALRDALK